MNKRSFRGKIIPSGHKFQILQCVVSPQTVKKKLLLKFTCILITFIFSFYFSCDSTVLFYFQLFYALIGDFSSFGRILFLTAFILSLKSWVFIQIVLLTDLVFSPTPKFLLTFCHVRTKNYYTLWGMLDEINDTYSIAVCSAEAAALLFVVGAKFFSHHSWNRYCLKRDWKCCIIPHTEVWGEVEEGEEEPPSNTCNLQLFSVLPYTLLRCNNAVIGVSCPTRWFKPLSAFSCFFCVPFLWRHFTLNCLIKT